MNKLLDEQEIYGFITQHQEGIALELKPFLQRFKTSVLGISIKRPAVFSRHFNKLVVLLIKDVVKEHLEVSHENLLCTITEETLRDIAGDYFFNRRTYEC